MAGLFDGIGNFIGDITGANAQKKADKSNKLAQQQLDQASGMNADVQNYINKGQGAIDASQAQVNSQLATNNANSAQAGQRATELYGQQQQANQDVRAANARTNASTGANAGEMMKLAQGAASQGAVAQANQAGGQAAAGARAAGLNAGQAALMASQGTSANYNQALNQGIDRYGQNVNTFQNQGQNLASQASGLSNQQGQQAGMQAQFGSLANQNIGQGQQNASLQQGLGNQKLQQAGQQANIAGGSADIGASQQQASNQKGQTLMGGVSTLGGAAIAATSDKNAKVDIKSGNMASVLDSMLKNMKPVKYKYKPGIETMKPEGTQRIGILAQDLENTPLADSVIDTPEGKKLDTPQLTANNTALIIELAAQIKELQNKLEGRNNG